jgi:threonine/homoserine/homoserine lactone efflux protein
MLNPSGFRPLTGDYRQAVTALNPGIDAPLAGFGLGFLVAAQVGPIWLLCARTVLRGSLGAGLAIGLGAALVDTAYAALGVAGTARLLDVPWLRLGLGLAGAGVLVALGTRTLRSALRVRGGGELDGEVFSPLSSLRTSLVATASNPSTIASWGAIFAAASAAGFTRSAGATALLLAGVGTGSMTWFAILSLGIAALRGRLGARAPRLADGVAGLGLVGFGGLLAWRAIHRG